MSKKKRKSNNTDTTTTSITRYNELESLLFPSVNNKESDPVFTENINDGRKNHFSCSRTGRCHCNGYLWFLKELGIYKCGDCGAVYDKVILDPDIIDDDNE